MLKISKLTDYGLLASVYLARKHGEVVSARDIAAFYQLPLPMITKVLKTLHQGGVIESQRGVSGGYPVTRDVRTLTLRDPIAVFGGPRGPVGCETPHGNRHDPFAALQARPSRRLLFSV